MLNPLLSPHVLSWLSDDDRYVIAASGYGRRQGFPDFPALVVIDATYDFLGTDTDMAQCLPTFPAGTAKAGWAALSRIEGLLRRARSLGLPVIFTRPKREEGLPGTVRLGKRTQASALKGWNEFPENITPLDGELLVEKRAPSAFFGTELSEYLAARGVDGIVLSGFTTSGCVRATAVDGASQGFKVLVPVDAVADRLMLSHWVSLLDIDLKYGDVVTADDLLDAVAS